MKLVVKQHRPVRKFLAISSTVVVLVVCGWLLVDYDQWQYIYSRMSNNLKNAELLDSHHKLDQQVSELQTQLAMARGAREIDQQAYLESRQIIREQQEEIQQLRQELMFYEQLLNNASQETGLVIQTLSMRKLETGHSREFGLVLTHIRRDDTVARGKFTLEIDGLSKGENLTLGMTELMPDKGQDIKFEFKHFTLLKGRVDLPEAFEPDRVKVRIVLETNPRKPYEKVFQWAELING